MTGMSTAATTVSQVSSKVYVGRQPILDRSGGIYAYELLYRDEHRGAASFTNADEATQRVVSAALLEWGFERLIGDRVGFINAAYGLLRAEALSILPPERTVIEVLEDILLDDTIISTVREAHATGMRFALDDVVDLDRTGIDQIAPYISVVKLDVLGIAPDQLGRMSRLSRKAFPNAQLLAEKVEDLAMYQECLDLGFDLFQGYYFAKPETLARQSRPTNVMAAVLLLAEVSRTDVDIARIESLISSDPSLAYSLLRLVNSSSFGLNVRVESIRQAIVLLGLVQVRQLAVLLTMAKNSVATSEEIIVLASIRAHMAQQLAPEAIAPLAFTTGLLSVIDTVLGTPMDELVSGLPLPVEVKDALLAGKGPIGEVMDVVYAFERADVTAVEQMRPGQADRMREIYASSVAWAEEVRRELSRAD